MRRRTGPAIARFAVSEHATLRRLTLGTPAGCDAVLAATRISRPG